MDSAIFGWKENQGIVRSVGAKGVMGGGMLEMSEVLGILECGYNTSTYYLLLASYYLPLIPSFPAVSRPSSFLLLYT